MISNLQPNPYENVTRTFNIHSIPGMCEIMVLEQRYLDDCNDLRGTETNDTAGCDATGKLIGRIKSWLEPHPREGGEGGCDGRGVNRMEEIRWSKVGDNASGISIRYRIRSRMICHWSAGIIMACLLCL